MPSVKLAYDLLIHGEGSFSEKISEAIQNSYNDDVTDEFIKPIILDKAGTISKDDVIIFFNIKDTLGETLAKAGKKQIRIAETEKYPHVTFFFNGGREEPFEGEERLLCPSPKVATYDLKPEMSAYDIRDAIVPELKKGAVLKTAIQP